MGRDFVLLGNQHGGKIEVRNFKPVSDPLQKGKTSNIHRISRRVAGWRTNSRLSARHLHREKVAYSQVVLVGRFALEALRWVYLDVCPERAEVRNQQIVLNTWKSHLPVAYLRPFQRNGRIERMVQVLFS